MNRSRLHEEEKKKKRNAQAEEELHQISEKLSHRLEELDQVTSRTPAPAAMFTQRPDLFYHYYLDAQTSSG